MKLRYWPLTIAVVVFWSYLFTVKDEPEEPTGMDLRREAIENDPARVRMVHPQGRSAFVPISKIEVFQRAGWVLAPPKSKPLPL